MARARSDMTGSGLQPYLDAISHSRTLTNEEEAHLARRIRDGDHLALCRLVEANLRFVINVARSYQNQGLPLADLINEGNIGMIKAATRFDERKNFRFITYAVWWVRQSILRALAESGRVVKLPLNRVGALHRISVTHSRLEQRLGRQPSTEEIGSVLKLKPREVGEAVAVGAQSLSLDSPLQEDDGACLGDNLQYSEQELPDDILEAQSFHESISEGLNALEKREREIVVLYYGLDDEEPYSLEDIGRKLHMTRERARQIKQRALAKLRRASQRFAATGS